MTNPIPLLSNVCKCIFNRRIYFSKAAKCILILIICIFFIANTFAQVGISSTSITPDASSILELRSTTQGFLPPRMTSTQRDAITSPATALLIYNTTTNQLNYYSGSAWQVVTGGGQAQLNGTGFVKASGTTISYDNSTYITNANVVFNNQANSYTTGMKQTFQSSATTAGFSFGGITADPSSLTSGDVWFRSDLGKLQYRDGTITRYVVGETLTQTLTNKNLSSTTNTFPVFSIANGGTNTSTALNNNRIMVSSGGAITEAGALTNGQLYIGSTSAAPVAANLTAGNGITITNGAGSINIAGYKTLVTSTSDQSLGSNASYADITGLNFSVTAGTTYRFYAVIFFTGTANGDGVDFAINGPASPTFISVNCHTGSSSNAQTVTNVTAYDNPTSNVNNATVFAGSVAVMTGIITPSANGTVTVRAKPRNTSKSIIKAGSSLEYW